MKKVLLIDKDISQGNILADAIRHSSREIIIVHSVQEAVSLFKREPIDLILLDIVPEADAAATVEGVRKGVEDVLKRKVPLIVLAKSFSESAYLLERADVDVLLEVSAHADQLNQIVEQFIGCTVI
ncbi:response regulator [Desulfovibrio aerotolerans]|uniref:Response regulator n=1 Tax=Solidesulfovibrio aerotolerans TaxID=295255 RepID=A0A7C9IUM5_9BACT|nr:response regulator [Solidesulfovibrio aerotolerans]MYL82803.1 response regulator [Solidesulfovibrio aerotolerans]